MQESWDVIVIGSGIGGLASASALAKYGGKRVLVLEQHYKEGGLTHEFSRKGYRFPTGIHYVGGMCKKDNARRLLDALLDTPVAWHRFPEPYCEGVFENFTLPYYASPSKFKDALLKQFPEEEKALGIFFKDVANSYRGYLWHYFADLLPQPLTKLIRSLVKRNYPYLRLSTAAYFQKRFKDARLRQVLELPWISYMQAPEQSSFGMHALIFDHYVRGAWFPTHGPAEIGKSLISQVKKAGGELLLRAHVEQILVEEGQAVGVKVRVKDRKQDSWHEFRAPQIISACGASNTYCHLLKGEPKVAELCQQLKSLPQVPSCLLLFLALKQSPQSLGFKQNNYWLAGKVLNDQAFKGQIQGKIPDLAGADLSFSSLGGSDKYSATFILPHAYEHYEELVRSKDDEAYQEYKKQLEDQLFQILETAFPSLKGQVLFSELATPLTMQHFLSQEGGVGLGLSGSPARFDSSVSDVKTPIKGLYLSGADSFSMGFVGALNGGVKAALLSMGPWSACKFFFQAFSRKLQVISLKRNRPPPQ